MSANPGNAGRIELNIVLNSPAVFRQLVDASCAFIQKTVINCSPTDGMMVNSVDPESVGLVKWCFEPGAFKSFRCAKNPLIMPIDFQQLLHVIRNAEPDEQVTLRKYALLNELQVIFGDEKIGSFFNIKLLDIEGDSVEPFSQQEDQTQVTLKAEEFHRMVIAFSHLDDTIHLDLAKNGVEFNCSSHTIGALRRAGQFYPHKPQLSTKSAIIDLKTGPVSEDYNIKYLKTFSKSCPLSDEAILRVSGHLDNILSITFPMNEHSYICFYLGPRHQTQN